MTHQFALKQDELTTRPIEGYPKWLADVPKGQAVKCSVWSLDTTPRYLAWVIGYANDRFIAQDGNLWRFAKPWLVTATNPKPSTFIPELLEAPNA